MRVHYISPSVLPSRAANAVHVVMQCDALKRAGSELTLYAKRLDPDASCLPEMLRRTYGVDASQWSLVTHYSARSRADNLRIAAKAVYTVRTGYPPDVVISRNLYAAYALAVLQNRSLIFETHQLEYGIRGSMQKAVIKSPRVTTVVISKLLHKHLSDHHGVAPSRYLVLHDAAPSGMVPVDASEKRLRLASIVPNISGSWAAVCAYFGHLYSGRGIEIIEALATARPQILFLVFGGNENEILQRRVANRLENLIFVGHVTHIVARQAMASVDILLMPYQTSVSIGVRRHDTAAWMSPMKMFEYLASGVPIVSSDLPALREVLSNDYNSILVSPDDSAAWIAAVDRLVSQPELAMRIGRVAHSDYLAYYTWDLRAKALLSVAEQF